MVKINVVFDINSEIQELKMVDGTHIEKWDIMLLPIRQVVEMDVSWMIDESYARIKDFTTIKVSWYKELIPHIVVDTGRNNGQNDICIYDIYRQQMRVLPSKLTPDVQKLKLKRYLMIAYSKMCRHLRNENIQRTVLANQQSIMVTLKFVSDSQKLISETMNELVARSFASVGRAPCSPTIRRPSSSATNIWKEKDEKFVPVPTPISSTFSSSPSAFSSLSGSRPPMILRGGELLYGTMGGQNPSMIEPETDDRGLVDSDYSNPS